MNRDREEATQARITNHRRGVPGPVWVKINEGAFDRDFRPSSGTPYNPHARPERVIRGRTFDAPAPPRQTGLQRKPTTSWIGSRRDRLLENILSALTGNKK